MAITFDAASNSGNKTAASSYSWNHTYATGAMLIVTVGNHQAATVSSISIGGTSLIFLCSQIAGSGNGSFIVEIWGTSTPLGTGATASITVTLSAAVDSGSAAVSAVGTFAANPYADGFVTAHAVNGGAADATVDLVVGVVDSFVIGAVVSNDPTVSAGAGQTERANLGTSAYSVVTSSVAVAVPAVTTVRFTNLGAAINWGVAAISLRPDAPVTFGGRRPNQTILGITIFG